MAADAAPEKKKNPKKLAAIGLVVVIVAGGAYETVLKPKQVAAATPGSVASMGPVVTEPQLTVNLAGGHYLQVSPALQLVKGAKPAAVSAASPQVLDLCIATFSGQDMATLGSPAGLAPLKTKLLAGLNTLFPHQVTGVYFTQFVMQ